MMRELIRVMRIMPTRIIMMRRRMMGTYKDATDIVTRDRR